MRSKNSAVSGKAYRQTVNQCGIILPDPLCTCS